MSHNYNNTTAISKSQEATLHNPEDTKVSITPESAISTALNGVDYKPTIDELLKALFEYLTNESSKFRQTWDTFETYWGKVQLDDGFCSDPSPKQLIKRLLLTEKADTGGHFYHEGMFAQMLAYNPFSEELDRYINDAGYNGQDHSKIRVIIEDNWWAPETLSVGLKLLLNIGVIVALYETLYDNTLLWERAQKKIAELKNEIA